MIRSHVKQSETSQQRKKKHKHPASKRVGGIRQVAFPALANDNLLADDRQVGPPSRYEVERAPNGVTARLEGQGLWLAGGQVLIKAKHMIRIGLHPEKLHLL